MKSLIILLFIFLSNSAVAEEKCTHLLRDKTAAADEWNEQAAAVETEAKYSQENELAPYLRYLRSQPTQYLTPDEENQIFESIKNQSPGWQKEMNRLVLSNQWFAFKHAVKFFPLLNTFHGISKMDLIQAANVGLLAAAKAFDPEQGRFKTIAQWYVTGEIRNVFNEQARLIRLPREFIKDIKTYKLKKEQMTKDNNGVLVSDYKVFSALGWSEEKMASVLAFSFEPSSLNAPLTDSENDGASIQDLIKAEDLQDQELDESDIAHRIERALSHLSSKEREYLVLRFGLQGQEEHTLDEIGQIYNLSRERIRQVVNQAEFKMRRYLKRIE